MAAGAGVRREDGGLGAERAVRIRQNALHAKTGNSANQRTARAHPSLDNENDREVKIDFNRCEDPMAHTRQKTDPTANEDANRGSHLEVSWLASFLF